MGFTTLTSQIAIRRRWICWKSCDRTSILVFAAKAEPVVRKLLSGNPVNIEQVTAETGVPADAIARTFVDEGVCAELTPELAAGFLQLGK
ncbi:hypothetical protein ACWDKQ_30230 [Saccharopolyspora sp. NPDC000995]